MEISLSSWHMEPGNWLSLEKIKLWDPDKVESPHRNMPICLWWPGCWVGVCFKPAPGVKHQVMTGLFGNWQVREREGGKFLVELAVHPEGVMRMPPVEEKPLVLADGEEEKAGDAERDPADFWKENATIYLMERVPFGMVTVRVPRNAKDTLAYARRRVKELLGLSRAPEAYTMHDYLNYKWETPEVAPASAGLHDDVNVNLHYHGFYEN